MKWLGLTGGIASGKSTVADLIRKRGVPVVDADQVVHELMTPGTLVHSEIVQAFGRDILGPDQSIQRRLLGQQVFNAPDQLRKLEVILHPRVRELVKLKRQELAAQGQRLAVYDVPLLFEKQMEKDFDAIIVVSTTEALQRQRMKTRNQLTEAEVAARLAAQIPLAHKAAKAHYVIENSGSLSELEAQVDQLLAKLTSTVG